jgi:hypothetical protein
MIREELQELVNEITQSLVGRNLDTKLEAWLNAPLPPASAIYRGMSDACKAGVGAGLICNREAGGIKFGRIIKPSDATHGFSVDVVEMEDIVGPHHVHSHGEIDLMMPISVTATFDGQRGGCCVCAPGSAHSPTVSNGRALVLYLLPGGAMQFTEP